MMEREEVRVRESWFGPAAGEAAMRLFCFPFAGANPNYFLPWRELVAPELELRIAQLPGHGGRWLEPPVDDFAELVTELTQAVAELADRPFAFFGHSVGALVAFEVARRLRSEGLAGPVGLWVSAAEGPQTRQLRRHLHQLPDAELIAALHDYNGTPRELLAEAELMELLLPGIRADFRLSECYRYWPEPPLDVPIRLLRGDEDPYVTGENAARWSRESTMPLSEHVFRGDHFFIGAHRRRVVELLKAGCLEGRPAR